jgi:hypothetical protein
MSNAYNSKHPQAKSEPNAIEFGIREGNRVISLPASAGAAGEGSVALIAANPVKVGIFRDFRGFAVIEACRGMSPSSGESQERAR